ncbi:MAG: DUF1257 domain-containing protein [Deltaproteobacteria bacterium]|nr:DUF1257 domain-containing protein [Deltaproteobacteria bacterium]
MSHFTTVQTEIHDVVCLKQALHDLGYKFTEANVNEEVHVRGYMGQKTKADMVIHVSKSYDVGVKVTKKGVKFIADWWGVETTRGLTEKEFVNQVTQRYAYHKVKQALQKKNYTLAEEEVTEDQAIHIKIKRW